MPDTLEGVRGLFGRVTRGATLIIVLVIGVALLLGVFGTISTGNIGVRTTLGVISQTEVPPGVYVKWPLISSVDEFTAKETAIDLTDLTPKAKDNLSLRDMDVSVYYRAEASKITELQSKYAGQSIRAQDGKYFLPAYQLVFRVARNVSYEEVARVDSLVMHTKREEISAAITRNMQVALDQTDPGVFHVTRV